ncbi:uncharacterized protein LOC115529506 [Gadus morhua]|uniref:Ciliary neurotrophic factor n=1 Tax=Gadus morhua TaxID=8049 RepID=A0A8C5BHC0_GADMO|nr:uncharacterized protein LOC115529506 [Gadus morhua]
MAEQEITADLDAMLDMPAPGRSGTGRAVALARLLHQECVQLLQLYQERESFLEDLTPEGGRIVSPSPDALDGGGPGEGPGVGELHGALRQCLGLLHCLIQREEEELGELEGEYEAMRKSVRRRLEHLVLSTCGLLSGGAEVGPDHSCTEEVDGEVGSFALKMWTYRVLLELLHWSDHAKMTLHNINAQSQDAEEDA